MIYLSYLYLSYGVLACFIGMWLSTNLNTITSKLPNKKSTKPSDSIKKSLLSIKLWWACVPMLIVLVVYFSRIYGIFGVPSVLTIALALSYLLQVLFNQPILVNKKTQIWFGFVATMVILMALGMFNVIGLDFYHCFDIVSLVVQYVMVATVFVVAYFLDQKSIWLAWAVLLAILFNPMRSFSVLDYVADIWLFLWLIGFLLKLIIKKAINYRFFKKDNV